MTRDQAVTIMQNLEVIKAFAEGRQIAIPIGGRLHACSTLCLSNFRSDRPLLYVVAPEQQSI